MLTDRPAADCAWPEIVVVGMPNSPMKALVFVAVYETTAVRPVALSVTVTFTLPNVTLFSVVASALKTVVAVVCAFAAVPVMAE